MPSLTLSDRDVARLETTLGCLLSPLAYPDLEAWRRDACAQILELLDADKVGMVLPGVPGELAITSGWDARRCKDEYYGYYWSIDISSRLSEKMRALGVYHRDMLMGRVALARDEAFNDWAIPHGMMDTIGMSLEIGSGFPFPFVHCYHNRDEDRPFGDRGLTLLRVLRPAFHAGARTARRIGLASEALKRSVDGLRAGVAFFDAAGTLVHVNPSLSVTLSNDPDGNRIADEIRALARAAGGLQPRPRRRITGFAAKTLSARLTTPDATYRLHSTLLAIDGPPDLPATMVWLERTTPEWPSPQALRARFGLTAREAQVALHLARGRSNEWIAGAMFISPHTARHHTEKALLKLGARARSEVGARILA